MKTIAIYILYYTGHLISKVMYFGWLYTIYNWCMVTSAELDTENKIWSERNDQ